MNPPWQGWIRELGGLVILVTCFEYLCSVPYRKKCNRDRSGYQLTKSHRSANIAGAPHPPYRTQPNYGGEQDGPPKLGCNRLRRLGNLPPHGDLQSSNSV